MKKFELLPLAEGETLHRIRALKDIPMHGVKNGDIGGYVSKEENLSQENDAWVYDDAEVFGNQGKTNLGIYAGVNKIKDHS